MSETPARGSSSSSAGARRAAARPALPPHVAAMCETLARELGDPVSGLQGFAEQLLRRLGKTDARGDVESIRAEARRCAEIVEQLTALQHGNVFQRVPVTPARRPIAMSRWTRSRCTLVSSAMRTPPGSAPTDRA